MGVLDEIKAISAPSWDWAWAWAELGNLPENGMGAACKLIKNAIFCAYAPPLNADVVRREGGLEAKYFCPRSELVIVPN